MSISERQARQIQLENGDILFVEGSGSVKEVGRAAIWNGSVQNIIHQNSIVRARLHDERLDPAFVETWFNSQIGNSYIRDQATTTSGLFHIGSAKLASAPIPIPPIDRQRELVHTYESTYREAKNAEEISINLAETAWTNFARKIVDLPGGSKSIGLVTLRFFEQLDRWDTNDDFLGLSSYYPIAHLDEIAEVLLGTQIPRKGTLNTGIEVPYLRAANVQRDWMNLADLKTMRVSQTLFNRLQLRLADILFVEGNSREEVGRAAIWSGGVQDIIIQNSIIRARLKTDLLLPEYVSAWFNSDAGRSYIRNTATTTSGSLWHIGSGKLSRAPIPVPPLDVQRSSINLLRAGLSSSSAAKLEAGKLQEKAERDFRDALLA